VNFGKFGNFGNFWKVTIDLAGEMLPTLRASP
jgi:hypothetical protein